MPRCSAGPGRQGEGTFARHHRRRLRRLDRSAGASGGKRRAALGRRCRSERDRPARPLSRTQGGVSQCVACAHPHIRRHARVGACASRMRGGRRRVGCRRDRASVGAHAARGAAWRVRDRDARFSRARLHPLQRRLSQHRHRDAIRGGCGRVARVGSRCVARDRGARSCGRSRDRPSPVSGRRFDARHGAQWRARRGIGCGCGGVRCVGRRRPARRARWPLGCVERHERWFRGAHHRGPRAAIGNSRRPR